MCKQILEFSIQKDFVYSVLQEAYSTLREDQEGSAGMFNIFFI